MRSIKILILALIAGITCHAQYVQPMGYKDYSFWGQVNIGNNGAKLTDPSAYLELGKPVGSTRGFLLPRGNKDSIVSPAYGLVIYNTPDSVIYWYNGFEWQNFATGPNGANNYPTSLGYASNILTIGRNGLSSLTVTLPFSSKLNIADTANKWPTVIYRRNDTLFYLKGGIETFACKIDNTWPGTSSQYIKGDGSLGTFLTDVQSIGDARYAALSHSHVASDISDFTTAVRNLFSNGTGITYNPSTGVIAWDGSGAGITSFNGLTGGTQTLAFDSTYSGASGWSSVGTAHTLRLNRRLFDTTFSHSPGYFDARYQLLSNLSTSTSLGTNNTLYPSQNAVKVYVDNAVSAATPSLTQYRLAVGNASNQLSSAAAITGSRAIVSDANGVPTHATTTAAQINYLSTTTSDVQTQINGKEASFTETTQEFTGSTSMSITLSNTPKSGKAEMYYLNGIVIKTANVSRTGTGVTLSGFTRESSDVITAKYSY